MFRHDYDFIRGNVSEGCAGQDNTMQGKWQSYELQTFTFYFLITLFSNQDREKKTVLPGMKEHITHSPSIYVTTMILAYLHGCGKKVLLTIS